MAYLLKMGLFGRNKGKEQPRQDSALSPVPRDCKIDLSHLMTLKGGLRIPEWMDLIQVWEGTYPALRKEQGWVITKSFDLDRLKIEWTVSNQVVVASIDRETGIITEKLKKPK